MSESLVGSEDETNTPVRKRWRQRVWWVRYLTYLGGVVVVLVATYVFFDLRGRIRFKNFVEELETRGGSLDVRKLAGPATVEESFWNDPFVRELLNGKHRDLEASPEYFFASDPEFDHTAKYQTSKRDVASAGWRNAHHAALTIHFPDLKLTRKEAAKRLLAALAPVSLELDRLSTAIEKPVAAFPIGNLTDEEILKRRNPVWSHNEANFFIQKAVCLLAIGKPNEGLSQIAASLDLVDLIRTDGSLADEWVATRIEAQTLQPIWDGLTMRVWNDIELQELKDSLERKSDVDLEIERLVARELAFQHVWLQQTLGSMRPRFSNYNRILEQNGYEGLIIRPPNWVVSGNVIFHFLDCSALGLTPGGMILENSIHREELNRKTLLNGSLPPWQRIEAERKAVESLRDKNARPPETISCLETVGGFLTFYYESRTQTEIARTAIAAEQFFQVHHRYPLALSDLVPEFLPNVPRDYWSGGNLIYRLGPDSRPIIYSVGQNGVDNGGYPNQSGLKGDLVWRYCLPTGYTIGDYLR